jgi:hypothetical protein
MDMGSLSEAVSFRWLFRKKKERDFPIPPVSKDHETVPPAVIRHLKVIAMAMASGDTQTVGNRQRRLMKLGVEVPTKPSHAEDLLRKYENAAQSDR